MPSIDILNTKIAANKVLPEGLWLNNRTWDLSIITLSAGLVFLPWGAYELFNSLLSADSIRRLIGIEVHDILDFNRNIINGLVALLIGGPHMYATFTRTLLDRDFRKEHLFFLLGSFILPFLVIFFGVVHFQILITLFFFWASIHIFHQITYIVDCYNLKKSKQCSLKYRMLDYIVVFSSLYPMGVWRMVNDDMKIGQIEILIPKFIFIHNNPIIGWGLFVIVSMFFFVSLIFWLRRTYREYANGEAHLPKSLLIGVTVIVSFFTPMYHELDVAFQGLNTWHSFQYLGLTWYINRIRGRGEGIRTPFVRWLSMSSRIWKFYFFNVGCALGTVAMIGFLLLYQDILGLSFDQCYYVVVLSILLMHYYHDHLLFTKHESMILS